MDNIYHKIRELNSFVDNFIIQLNESKDTIKQHIDSLNILIRTETDNIEAQKVSIAADLVSIKDARELVESQQTDAQNKWWETLKLQESLKYQAREMEQKNNENAEKEKLLEKQLADADRKNNELNTALKDVADREKAVIGLKKDLELKSAKLINEQQAFYTRLEQEKGRKKQSESLS